MSAANHRWLLDQLPQWQQEGLVTAEAANTLRQRAQAAAADGHSHLGQIVLGILGALLVGTGLIAIIGYNWDDFGRPLRLLFAFLPLLLSQLFSVWVIRRGRETAAWVREAAALLQILAAGACLAIVSQIYNLGGEWPEFLFVWCWLTLPVVWIFGAHGGVLFYLATTTTWVLSKVDTSATGLESPWLYLGFLAGLIPYLVRLKLAQAPLPNTVRWLGMIALFAGLGAVAEHAAGGEKSFFYHFIAVQYLWGMNLVALMLIPLSAHGRSESSARKPQVVLGFLYLLSCGMGMTFAGWMTEWGKVAQEISNLSWSRGVFAVIVVFAGIAAWHRRWAVLAVAGIAFIPLLSFTGIGSAAVAWIATVYLFLAGLTLILLEFAGRQGAPRLGAMLLSVLILVRFSDSEFSLLHKGVIFVVVGACFLAFNIFMGRWRRSGRAAA